MNDYGKPQNDKAQQDEQTHDLIEQLNLLETVDRRITPEHVAKRFRQLLDDIGDNGPPSPAAQHSHGIPDQPGCGDHLTRPWRNYNAEHWAPDLLGLSGSLEAAVAAARNAAADIIADAQLKAKTVSDELRRSQETVTAARQLAEQIVAEAHMEADEALKRAVKMIRDAESHAAQIISDAHQEAEQILTAARNQKVEQTARAGHGFSAVVHRHPATRQDTETEPETTDWTARGACKEADPDELFVQGAAQERAKIICRGCAVRTECLADALDNGIEFGVWGGMTEKERRALLRRRPDVTSWRELLELARDEYELQRQEATAGPDLTTRGPRPPQHGNAPLASSESA